MPLPPPAPVLPEEVVEEILLRLPPHKPACLVRASVVSKPWLALLSSARFRGRYRRFHGAPPMLGFLKFEPWNFWQLEDPSPPFVSTTRFHARIHDDSWGQRGYVVLDCRHGRILLGEKNAEPMKLAVWDPMTGRRRKLQEPGCMAVENIPDLHAAVVLCAVSSCDHRAAVRAMRGPSRWVFFSLHDADDDGDADFVAQACVASLQMGDCSKLRSDFHRGEWSEPSSGLPISTVGSIMPNPPILVQNAVHFMLAYEYEPGEDYDDEIDRAQILKYDLGSNCLSLIDAPSAAARDFDGSVLMALEDGSLGFAHLKKSTLYIWSRMGFDGAVAWTRRRVISLRNIPPSKAPQNFFTLLGSIEGRDIIFVYTELGIYKVNVKTLRRKKI